MPTSGFEICALEGIPDGRGRVFQLPTEQNNLCLLVLRSGDHCFGYINRCPHFGVPLAACDSHLLYEPNRWVKCNVHYARFRWQDGFCEAGECAGESLQRVPLEVKNGKILLAAYF
jgi:nitrite reductase/ring-hydroxylating ferredoxin subunit